MKRALLRILVLGVGFLLVTEFVPTVELTTGSMLTAFFAAAVFAVLNLLVTPLVLLVKLIALPLTLLTLGLMSLIISFAFNVLIFWLMGLMEWGIRVHETSGLILGPLALSIITAILNLIISPESAKGVN